MKDLLYIKLFAWLFGSEIVRRCYFTTKSSTGITVNQANFLTTADTLPLAFVNVNELNCSHLCNVIC